jgi:hypothetical protein
MAESTANTRTSDAHFIRSGTAPVHGSGGLETDEFLLGQQKTMSLAGAAAWRY